MGHPDYFAGYKNRPDLISIGAVLFRLASGLADVTVVLVLLDAAGLAVLAAVQLAAIVADQTAAVTGTHAGFLARNAALAILQVARLVAGQLTAAARPD